MERHLSGELVRQIFDATTPMQAARMALLAFELCFDHHVAKALHTWEQFRRSDEPSVRGKIQLAYGLDMIGHQSEVILSQLCDTVERGRLDMSRVDVDRLALYWDNLALAAHPGDHELADDVRFIVRVGMLVQHLCEELAGFPGKAAWD